MADSGGFGRVEEVFQQAVALSKEERPAFLEEACAGNAELRSAVEALLRADESTGSDVLDRGVSAETVAEVGQALWADPERIAGYRVVRRIGSGGMGVVYEAVQDRPERRVAIKVLRPERVGASGAKRMEFEGEVLGRLAHPGVATVYEAGVWEEGGIERPYVAMELVEGRAITEYAAAERLGVRAKLNLVRGVCEAIQHAHQRGVIHRDLKPANILVDGEGNPKIVDFGIAHDAQAVGEATATGHLMGTLAYMAPERLSGKGGSDARGDIYALGAVLYELLSGALPHEVDGGSLTDTVRRVTEEEPALLGASDPGLRGDVEVIVATALARDPGRRYASASALGDDIGRALADLPILARRPSTVYAMRKFARRNRALVGAAAVVLLGVVVGVVGIAIGFSRAVKAEAVAEARRVEAVEQRAEAEKQAGIALAVSNFLHDDLLAAASPDRLGYEATVREAIDDASAKVGERFADDALLRGTIRNTLGGLYDALSVYSRSEEELLLAIADLEDALGSEDELTERARLDLGRMYKRVSRFDDAEPLLVGVFDRWESLYGDTDARTLEVMVDLIDFYGADLGRMDDARALMARFDAGRVGVIADDDLMVGRVIETDAAWALGQQDYEAAAEAYGRVLEIREKAFGDEDRRTLSALQNVGVAYEALERYDEAEAIYERVLAAERMLSGPDNLDTLAVAHNLAFLYQSTGRYEEAEALYRDTLERCERVLGPAHEGTLTCKTGLGSLLRDTDRLDEALVLFDEAYEAAKEAYGAGGQMTLFIGQNYGMLLNESGQAERCLEVLLEVVPAIQRMAGEIPPVAQGMAAMAQANANLGNLDEARRLFGEARRIFVGTLGPEHHMVGRMDRMLGQLEEMSAPSEDPASGEDGGG